MPELQLHLPQGINYECTSCGKCCGGWAVPMTEEDYDKVAEIDWGDLNPVYKKKTLFRQLRPNEAKGTPYTYKIVADGPQCPFLVDNLCFIHSKHGAETKPSICQLFPYCFSETPSGVYATVSFVSLGALFNSGKPLAEQQDQIEKKWSEFKRLYPDYHPDWSKIKLTVDQPISWDEYLQLETRLLECLSDNERSLEERMLRGAEVLALNLRRAGDTAAPIDGTAPIPEVKLDKVALKSMDVDLLTVFHRMYFPHRTLKSGEVNFDVMRLVRQCMFGQKKFNFPDKRSYTCADLMEAQWPERDPDMENLLYRYFYSYIFGKKFFGAGFGQVSVIAGYHHLILLLTLIKLHSRACALLRGSNLVSMVDLAAAVRQSERLVGETKLGGYSAAAWELMLASKMRAKRFLANS